MILAPGKRGQQAHQIVAFDEVAFVVVEETAVEVAVPGDAQVGLVLAHGAGGGGALFGQQGVGHAVGEAAVGLHLAEDELVGQVRGQLPEQQAGAAVARVGHDPEGLLRGGAGVVQDAADILLPEADRRHRGFVRRQVHARGQLGRHAVAQVVQAGIAAHGPGAAQHQLEAVLVGRVVAAGDHDAGVEVLPGGGIVDLFGAAHAQAEDPGPGLMQARGQRGVQHRAAQTGIVAEDDAPGGKMFGYGAAQGKGQLWGQGIGHLAADVIGLEAGKIGHGGSLRGPVRPVTGAFR